MEKLLFVAATIVLCASAYATPYTEAAATSVPTKRVAVEVKDDATGEVQTHWVETKVEGDNYGNADGNQYDLAIDGAFEGQTIAVIQLYTGGGFDFELPRAVLREKGFSVYRWSNAAPSPDELAVALDKSTQLWIISGDRQHLNDEHLEIIREFYEEGHGLYLWGDNPPYTGDANFVSSALFDVTMDSASYSQAEQVVSLQQESGATGLRPNHLITTGIEFLYEGHTIPAIQPNNTFEPLIIGSDNILVAGTYDRDGKRAILDTGFTRLYINWDTAGTGRYVKNAAAWLVNVERFGDAVVSDSFKTDPEE
jgi:hypothetical protein